MTATERETVLSRAYSLLDIKAVDEDRRILEGIASTPSPDRVGDILDPKGADFKLPMPLLWQHRQDQPIGEVFEAKVTPEGIRIKAQIARAGVADYIDLAWSLIREKLVRGLSVGWRATEPPKVSDGFFLFPKWLWLELSAVTIAANQDATITAIKSVDDQYLAALGVAASLSSAGVPASRETTRLRKVQSKSVQTHTERITEIEATIQTKKDDLEALQGKVTKEGRTKDAGERESFDTLATEIGNLEAELADVKVLEAMNAQKAAPVNGKSAEEAAQSRSGSHSSIRVEPVKLPPGVGFARAVKAFAVARMDARNPVEVAKEMYPSDTRLLAHVNYRQNLSNVIAQIKAAVPAATTTDPTWAGALTDPTNLAEEFIEFLRPQTIIGRLNLRRLDFNVRMIEQTQGGTAYWVGQGAPKPLTSFGYAPITLGPTKVATIAVASEESVRLSRPSLDTSIRDALAAAVIERIDVDLLDPASAGLVNVQPASLTNGLTPLTSSGSSADNVRTDIARLVQAIRGANIRGPIALVMPEALVTLLAFMVNALGQPEFTGLQEDGGTINRIRVIGSDYLANTSGFGNMVVAIAEREVFLADDGQVTVDLSREASLQMLDDPTNNSATATPTTMVSMWQTNSVAFRAERWINWLKRRAAAVAYMDDVNWGSVGSP